jgi:predicted O-methyltransferase YrrM
MNVTEEMLLEWVRGYQISRVILTAVELDIFAKVGEGASAADVAASLGAPERPVDRLLNALATLGLLSKEEGTLSLTEVSARYLAPKSPEYMANLRHSAHLWDAWSGLTEVVKTGTSSNSMEEMTTQRTEAFIAAMQQHSKRSSPDVAAVLDMEGVGRILDVGGGSGAFTIALTRKAGPSCTASLFDLPAVTALARNYLAEAGMSARIDTVDGDYNVDPLPEGYDLVFMSSIVHINSPEQNVALVQKGADALNRGGRLVIREFVINEQRTGPPPVAIFALNMLVNTPGGDTYTASEMSGWMTQAGLSDIQFVKAGPVASLVIGRK